MKQLIAFLIFSAAAFAQNTTTITATQIHGSGITLLASGKLCFTPVDDSGNPQGYRAGAGGQGTVDEKCTPISNGAIGSWSVDNPDFTSPLHLKYTIRVTDSNQNGKEIRRDTAVDMSGNGGTWSYDAFTPSAGTVLGNFSCPTGYVVAGITPSGQLVCVVGGGASGIFSLNTLIAATQVFANDTNVGISSSGFTHSLTWTGTLSKARQHSQTVYLDALAQTFVNGITAPSFSGALTGNASTASALAGTPTLCGAGNYPLGILANGNATGCTAASGAGTVTSFSSGNLSPLFTTNVTNPTTTPALAFTLSTAAGNTVFGNNTGSTAAPAFVSLTKAMQQSQTAYLDSIQTFSAAQTFTPQIVATGGLITPNNVALQSKLFAGTIVDLFKYDTGNNLVMGANQEILLNGSATIQPPASGGQIVFKTGVVDSGSAVGINSDTANAFSTSGAKLQSWKNATVEKASLSYDGFFNAIGGYKVGGSALNFSHLAGSAACGQLPAETGDVTSSGCATTLASVVSASTNTKITYDAKGRVTAGAQAQFSDVGGSVAATQMPALTGDVTSSAGTVATTLATVNSNVGTFMKLTVNGKGLVTAATTAAVADLSDGATVATKVGIQNSSYSAAADTGAADAYAMCPSPAVGSYSTNQEFVFKALNANTTTTPTLNVCALGTKTITKQGTAALAANDIKANCVVTVFYDGTQMQMTSPPCQASGGGSGTVTNTGTLTAGRLMIGNGGVDITVGDLSGDTTTSGSTVTTVAKVHGITYPVEPTPSLNLAPVMTSAGTVSYIGVMQRPNGRRWSYYAPDCANNSFNQRVGAQMLLQGTQNANCGDANNEEYATFTSAATSGVDVGAFTNAAAYRWGRNNVFQALVNTDSTATRRIWVGYSVGLISNIDASDNPNTVQVAAFHLKVAGTNWFCYLSNGASVSTDTDSTIAVNAGSPGTLQFMEIREDSTGFTFFINGSQVCNGMSQANKPTGTTNGVNAGVTLTTTAATVSIVRSGFIYLESH